MCEDEPLFASPGAANEQAPRRRGTTTDQQAMEARLADASTRIDEIASRAQEARDDTRVRVQQRVNALRTRQTEVRAKARAAVEAEIEAWDDTFADLDRELGEMDIEIAIAESQLALDSADDRATFEAAVGQQIEAYRAYAELLGERAASETEGTRVRGDAAAESIRVATATAVGRLQRYHDLTNEVAGSLRAGVLAALDDLDRTAARARGKGDAPGLLGDSQPTRTEGKEPEDG